MRPFSIRIFDRTALGATTTTWRFLDLDLGGGGELELLDDGAGLADDAVDADVGIAGDDLWRLRSPCR